MNLLQDSFTLSTQSVSLSEYKIWVDACAFDPTFTENRSIMYSLNGL